MFDWLKNSKIRWVCASYVDWKSLYPLHDIVKKLEEYRQVI